MPKTTISPNNSDFTAFDQLFEIIDVKLITSIILEIRTVKTELTDFRTN